MKLNKELCVEVLSNLMDDEALGSNSKMTVLLVGTVISGKITNRLFSEDEEIEIVSNGSGREDK